MARCGSLFWISQNLKGVFRKLVGLVLFFALCREKRANFSSDFSSKALNTLTWSGKHGHSERDVID